MPVAYSTLSTVEKVKVYILTRMLNVLFRIKDVCFPPSDPLAPALVPLAQAMGRYDYCIRFVERSSPRFLDIYCICGMDDYDELWTEAETSFYETCQSSEDED